MSGFSWYPMNLGELRKEWQIPEPWSLHPITNGINNLTQIVETPAGVYILRSYGSERSLEHIRYELNLLRILQQKNLPFQIPAPLPTTAGKLFAVLSGTIMTMSPRLPGSIPQNDNLEQAHSSGQTLAELVKALADIQLEITPQMVPFPLSSDFEGWAGIPVDPADLIQKIPLTREKQQQIIIFLENTRAFSASLYQTMPQQIIHRDYDPSNILMEANSVTGVLDFEFCGPDLRILDLAYALSQWPAGLWNTGKEWLVIDAFARGYLQRQALTSEELDILPFIFRLRATASLFFRLGRYARGLETSEIMLEHTHEVLQNEAWLRSHEGEFMSHIHSWYS
jgi:homoserine kinase type II